MKLYSVLYHGSDVTFDKIDLSYGQSDGMEFGKGFYLSPDFEIAKEFAKFKSNDDKYYVLSFEFDIFSAENNLNILIFENYSIEWHNFINECKINEDNTRNYDIIIGPLLTIESNQIYLDHKDGKLTSTQANELLRILSTKMQVAIKTEKATKYLTKIAEEVFEND